MDTEMGQPRRREVLKGFQVAAKISLAKRMPSNPED
jgi:hypothetical protein